MSRRKGFTLVELLVVIGIIAVLISILMPALSRVRQQAQQIKCAANLHSMGQALTMYTQQYGYYPCCFGYGPGSTTNYGIWPARLRSFLAQNDDVFYCPAEDMRCQWHANNSASRLRANSPEQVAFGYREGELLISETDFFSYAYNYFGVGAGLEYPKDQVGLGMMVSALANRADSTSGEVRANKVRMAAELIAIGDATADGWGDYAMRPDYFIPRLFPGAVHRQGANILFCDGHVAWYSQSELINIEPSTLAGSQMRRMWNNDHQPH